MLKDRVEQRPATLSPSQFSRIMAVKGLGKDAETYSIELVHQLLGVPKDDFTSYAMQWGVDNEPFAVQKYEQMNLVEVKRNVRQYHPEYDFISGEVDGLVGDDGIIEIKCPSSANHLKNLFYGEQLENYKYQIQGYLWIFGREWCDFISYDPRFKEEKHAISIHAVERDQAMIDLIEERCLEFWNELVLPKLNRLEELSWKSICKINRNS